MMHYYYMIVHYLELQPLMEKGTSEDLLCSPKYFGEEPTSSQQLNTEQAVQFLTF